MHLTIVRHASAGQKREWTDPDIERPLDDLGRRQTEVLTSLLRRARVARIVSSPAVRCLQTVTPLATAVGVPVEVGDDLGPDGFTRRILVACLADPAFDDAVLCTHGELLSPLLQRDDISRLARRNGIKRDVLLTKGSAWRLGIDADGTVTKLTHLLPRLDDAAR
jgi:8-oxo-dGTP diphosphatase